MISWDDFIKKLPKKPRRDFTCRYYGTRQLNVFPESFLKYINQYSGFIDVTAGGGRFPYHLAALGKTIGLNDRCYYSYCALDSVFCKREFSENWFRDFWISCYPDQVVPLRGYSTNHYHTNRQIMNEELRQYIDALCVKYRNDPFVLYAVGKAIRSIFTFRGLDWCNKTPASVGMLSIDVDLEYFFKVFMKALWVTSLYNQQLPPRSHEVFGTDASVAIKNFSSPIISRSMVYCDPAWPWHEKYGSQPNPYKYFTEDLSSILLQEEQKVYFWTRDKDLILNEVGSWIKTSFDAGAPCVTICSQDTNYPSTEVIRNVLNQQFNMVDWLEVEDKSKSQHHIYKTVWGIFKP